MSNDHVNRLRVQFPRAHKYKVYLGFRSKNFYVKMKKRRDLLIFFNL